jgi:predicted DNA-binding transcriptional regulator YafY
MLFGGWDEQGKLMDRVVRIITMLQLLPRHPRSITAARLREQLAERGFERTERSIQRDLLELSEHFPVLADESQKPFAWSFDAQSGASTIPSLDLSGALTFQLAHAYLSPVLPARVLDHLEPQFKEAEKALKHSTSALSDWPNRVRMIARGLQTKRPSVDGDVLVALTEALLTERRCQIVYQARSWPEKRNITVHPYGLIFREPNIYLIGAIEGREGTRQLVLHRMFGCTVAEERAERPSDFDLDAYIKKGAMGILHSDKSVSLKLLCDKPEMNHLLEAPLAEDQEVIENQEHHFVLRATMRDTQDLRWWLLAQSAHIDIIGPSRVRTSVLEMALSGIARLKGVDSWR